MAAGVEGIPVEGWEKLAAVILTGATGVSGYAHPSQTHGIITTRQ